MSRNEKRGIPAIGVSSLLIIFTVLCLTVFALLSVASAQADQALSDKAASSVEGYYAADFAAEETLALLRSGEKPSHVKERNGIYYYAHEISATQTLEVEVRVDGSDYEILRWQAVPSSEWHADDELPVWDGEMKEDI
ncbi:MAG: hypothetical protein IJO79_06470 [Firmicutes bacterium]|nr:hypothetical protein [Bacillota bacterium]